MSSHEQTNQTETRAQGPRNTPNAAGYQRSFKELPEPHQTISRDKYEVAIIGAGPAGLFSGVSLARLGWNVLAVDNRSEPTIAGRAGSSP
jgi:heterodisulfide reductase subunit A-like polyferredoxin